jgi:hypothetical protein
VGPIAIFDEFGVEIGYNIIVSTRNCRDRIPIMDSWSIHRLPDWDFLIIVDCSYISKVWFRQVDLLSFVGNGEKSRDWEADPRMTSKNTEQRRCLNGEAGTNTTAVGSSRDAI